MRVAHAEGRDCKKELPKFLLAYRSTAHTTTGVSPAKLLFRREIRAKLPGLEDLRPVSSDTEFLNRDRKGKQKRKDYADNLRGAWESNLKDGDKVLLQQLKSDKLSPSFEATPYEAVNKHGVHVEIKSPAGARYRRNITYLQKNEEDKPQETKANSDRETSLGVSEASHAEEQKPSGHRYSLRPRRDRQPERLKDFERD